MHLYDNLKRKHCTVLLSLYIVYSSANNLGVDLHCYTFWKVEDFYIESHILILASFFFFFLQYELFSCSPLLIQICCITLLSHVIMLKYNLFYHTKLFYHILREEIKYKTGQKVYSWEKILPQISLLPFIMKQTYCHLSKWSSEFSSKS